MKWEGALWCSLAWAGAAGIPRLTAWLVERGSGAGQEAARALRWLHLFPLYLALLTGAVSGRDAGLYGQDSFGWASGALASSVVVVLAAALLWWRAPAAQWPPVWVALADEARWALYRAAGSLWVGSTFGGAATGLVLAVLEWLVEARPWKSPWSTIACPGLSRQLTSSLLFALTGNAWLTWAAHLAILTLARRSVHAEGR